MKTGQKKAQKTTEIFFDEASRWITVNTYNTDLKNRLTAYAKKHPDLCRLTDDTEDGGLSFEVAKSRFCFRLTKPDSDERRAASEFAKKQNNDFATVKFRRGVGCPFQRAALLGKLSADNGATPHSPSESPLTSLHGVSVKVS